MVVRICMESDAYGSEFFDYESFLDAYEGLARLALKCAVLNDGIERRFTIVDVSFIEVRETD